MKVVVGMALTMALGVTLAVVPAPVAGASGGTIRGSVFEDTNRNGVRDAGEAGWSGMQLYLFSGDGSSYLGTVLTDTGGLFQFQGLADGSYRVDLESGAWSSIRMQWAPTTTGGSLYPQVHVNLVGQATADLGWRPIQWSTDLNSPLSRHSGPSGVSVASYNDAVTAREVHDVLAGGSFIGAEAPYVTVRVGYGDTSSTASGASSSNGVYTSYSSASYVSYAAWLETRHFTLFHEYGHAWSMYYAFIAQQDPELLGYLQARGLAGDSRVNSSYGWSARELIAEDYRQLFGTAGAAAVPQANTQIPPASDVPGLREYLSTTFTTPSNASPPPEPDPVEFDVTLLTVAPAPVKATATVTYGLSEAATVTVRILDVNGNVVKTLVSGAQRPAGSSSVVWDRTNASGRRVKSGTYSVRVDATDAAGESAASAVSFSVS